MSALKYWNGSEWVTLPDIGAKQVWTGPEAPVPIGDHRLWIDTNEPDPALVGSNAWQSNAYGAATAGLSGWQITPIPTSFAKNGDAGAFTRNADGTLTVRDDGMYAIDAVIYNNQGTAEARGAILGRGTVANTIVNSQPDIFCQNILTAGSASAHPLSATVYLAAGQIVAVLSLCTSSAPRFVVHFSIARVGTGPAGPPGPPGPGSILSTLLMEGENAAYVGFATGTNVTVNAAQNKALQWNYTPPVDVWVEVSVNIGLVQKTDAAYHYAVLRPMCTPAPVFGAAGEVIYRTQHVGVNQYEPYTYTKLYGLSAGVPYAMYSQWSIQGGTWLYHQGSSLLYMHGKAWAR